jgi:hypothetical protein
MKRYFLSKWFRVLAVIIGALGCAWAGGAAWDTYKVAKMTEQMKTVCVGRMLVDLPVEAQVEFYGQWIHGFDIEAFAESSDAFNARVAERETAIRAKPDRLGGNGNMESVREVQTASGLAGKMFVHGRNVTEGDAYNAVGEEHYRYEGVALEAHVHGDGVANPTNRIPTEPGFCIDRATIRDPLTAEQGERITMAVKLPSSPDIGINFDTIAGTKPDARGLLMAPAVAPQRFTLPQASPGFQAGIAGAFATA